MTKAFLLRFCALSVLILMPVQLRAAGTYVGTITLPGFDPVGVEVAITDTNHVAYWKFLDEWSLYDDYAQEVYTFPPVSWSGHWSGSPGDPEIGLNGRWQADVPSTHSVAALYLWMTGEHLSISSDGNHIDGLLEEFDEQWIVWQGSDWYVSMNRLHDIPISLNRTRTTYDLPDLTVENIRWRLFPPDPGTRGEIFFDVRNAGAYGTYSGTYRVWADGQEVASDWVWFTVLPNGGSLPVYRMSNLLSLSPGTHTLTVDVDVNHDFPESDENNIAQIAITALPDLVVGSHSLWPEHPDCADTVSLSFMARNLGIAWSSACNYVVFVDGVQKDGGPCPALPPEGYVGSQYIDLGTLPPGTHWVEIRMDSDGTVPESDEDNNPYFFEIPVLPLPDLSVESTWWGPVVPDSLATVSLGFNVRNLGDVVSSPCLYSLLIDGEESASGTLGVIPPGDVDTHQNVLLGPFSPTTHTLWIVADSLGEVRECRENNNELVTSITVTTPPDLWVEACRFQPASPNQTQQIVLEFDARNSGGCASSVVDFVVREGAHALHQGRVMPVPAGGLATSQGIRVGPFAPGPHTLRIEVDSGHALAESNETNNTFDQPVTVQLVLKAGEAWMLY